MALVAVVAGQSSDALAYACNNRHCLRAAHSFQRDRRARTRADGSTRSFEGSAMDKLALVALAALTLAGCATPIQTAGTTAGAVGGAVVGGPVGAVVGGATGAVVTAPWSPFGGPYYHRHHRCRWYDVYGHVHYRSCW